MRWSLLNSKPETRVHSAIVFEVLRHHGSREVIRELCRVQIVAYTLQ